MVNAKHMQLWIDGLRSGDYRKIEGRLETGEGNCAAGVACREAIKHGAHVVTTLHENMRVTAFDEKIGMMPASVRRWLGLGGSDDETRPLLMEYHGAAISIYEANDDRHLPFPVIADLLYEAFVKEPRDG